MCDNKGYKQRKELLKALETIVEFNDMPFYPNGENNFTQTVNGFSSLQCNHINDIIDKFKGRIKEWDYRKHSDFEEA